MLILYICLHGLTRYVFIEGLLLAVFIYGIFDRNCLFLWMGVLINIVKAVIVAVVATFYIIYQLINYKDKSGKEMSEGNIFAIAFFIALYLVICALVIYSYTCELRDEEKDRTTGDNVEAQIDDPSNIVPSRCPRFIQRIFL